MITGKPSGAGKNSSCTHTAQKNPWSPPPLTFAEQLQGTCSCTLPQWALSPHSPATGSSMRDHNRLWWIEDDIEKTQPKSEIQFSCSSAVSIIQPLSLHTRAQQAYQSLHSFCLHREGHYTSWQSLRSLPGFLCVFLQAGEGEGMPKGRKRVI